MPFVKNTFRGLIKNGNIQCVRKVLMRHPELANDEILLLALDAGRFTICKLVIEISGCEQLNPKSLQRVHTIATEKQRLNFLKFLESVHNFDSNC
jgi:hypothetical protein